jgi:hypothetical protein
MFFELILFIGLKLFVEMGKKNCCGQQEFIFSDLQVLAGAAGDSVVAESASSSTLTLSVDFVLTLVSS